MELAFVNPQIVRAHITALTKLVSEYTSDPIANEVCSLLDKSLANGDTEAAIAALDELHQWIKSHMSEIQSNSFTTKGDVFKRFESEIPDLIEFVEKRDSLLTATAEGTPKRKMVFISHSSRDAEYVTEMVELLRKMGLGRDNLFCSSYPGYGIPTGEPIYDFLKHCFTDYDLYVILMISKGNYYASPASLNEMGAAWVLGSTCIPILLPGMNPGDMQGAIGSSRLAIMLDSSEAKYRLTDFKDSVCGFLGLPTDGDDSWDYDRDQFLKHVRAIEVEPEPTPQPKGQLAGIIDGIVDGSVTMSEALLKLKVIAHRAGDSETERWAEKELKGYDQDDELPAYRKTRNFDLHYTGINGMFQVKDASLPIGFLSEKTLDSIKDISTYDGITTIEQAIASDKFLAIDRTILAGEVSKNAGGAIQCTSILQKVPMSFFESILAAVKTRTIDILLQDEESSAH